MSLPRAARWLVRALAPPDWRDSLIGDLEEEQRRRRDRGRPAGAVWAAAAAVSSSLHLRRARREPLPAIGRRPRITAVIATDLHQAARAVLRRPAAAIVIVVTLTLGLSATTSAYSLANWLMLRPIPGVRSPETIVTIKLEVQLKTARGMRPMSVSTWRELAALPGLGSLAGAADAAFHVATGRDAPTRVSGAAVTSNYFDVLGHTMSMGRGFGPGEDDPGRADVVVVSDHFWRTSLGADPHVLGRTFLVNGHPFTVVGVAARGFRGPDRSGHTVLWVPVASHRHSLPQYTPTLLTDRRGIFFSLVGRPAPGATVDQIAAQAQALRTRLVAAAARGSSDIADHDFAVRPGIEIPFWQRDRLPQMLSLILTVAAMLLVLACANAANLLYANAHRRRAELATRQAIGASRLRLAGQLVWEGVLLGVASGACALAIAAGVGWLTGDLTVSQYLPALPAVPLDWRVFWFAAAVSMITCVAASLVPALAGTRVEPRAALAAGGRWQSGPGRGLRRALTVVQIAVAVTLLSVGLLLVRSVGARYALPLGYDADRVLAFSLEPGVQGHSDARIAEIFRAMLPALRATPGIEQAGLAWVTPFRLGGAFNRFRAVDRPTERAVGADANFVSSGFFPALGAPLVAGRDFTDAEGLAEPGAAGEGVAILNEAMARALFGDTGAIGRVVEVPFEDNRRLRVVGVVADIRTREMGSEPVQPTVYEPFQQSWGSVHVRLSAPATEVLPRILEVVRGLDPTLPIYDVEPLSHAVDRHLAEPRLVAKAAGIIAAIAVVVAGIGLYGVLARGVEERRREFGIRAALGAAPRHIARLVTGEAAAVTAVGGTLGVAGAIWLARSIEARLYGVSPLDAGSLATATALVVVMAIAASIGPARRALRLDVVDELR